MPCADRTSATPGKLEARKLLERHAYDNTRLLGAFNKNVDDFIDFVTYTCFIDRDGKYQLTMLHHSSFAPLSREHGANAERRSFPSVYRTKRPVANHQGRQSADRDFAKISQQVAFDRLRLFGKDHSSAAARFYRWGFKGRFDEATAKEPPKDLDRLNEEARNLYYKEDCEIIEG